MRWYQILSFCVKARRSVTSSIPIASLSALKTRAQNIFHLSDQELLIRQFHTVVRDTVGAYQSAKEA